MPFPEVKRVRYEHSPLEQVICQLRFPAILKIDAKLPADFQEQVRGDYPILNERHDIRIDSPAPIEDLPPEIFQQAVEMSGNKNYEFVSDNEDWKVNLTRTFITLSTRGYSTREDFQAKLLPVLEAFTRIYSPSYFSRIGLRYIDVIRRSTVNLAETQWSELIAPEILGILASPILAEEVENYEAANILSLGEGEGSLKLMIKLVKARDDGEIALSIDGDFYTSKRTSLDDAIQSLNFLHEHASRLIRWAITDKLHNAMEPRSI